MRTWKLKRTRQCKLCPWRKAVDPTTIPNGYSADKHRALASTIAAPGDLTGLTEPTLPVMTCHETQDAHCIGWLHHQLGPGNNLPLRLHMRGCTNGHALRLRGEQHATFEETLPRPRTATQVMDALRQLVGRYFDGVDPLALREEE